MEQSDKTQNIDEKILLTLYNFEPSLGLFMKLLQLNKDCNIIMRKFLQDGLILRINHRDYGQVSKHLVRRICKYLGENLKALDFEFSTVTDEHIEVTQFPETLIELNLNGCREISEKACMHFQKQCKNLERLELYWNCRITDFGMKKVAMMNPKLSYVNLSGCKYLSDSSIMALAQNCPNIYHFNLTRIPKLSEKSFEDIANLKDLEYLNLYANAEIKDQGFQTLSVSQYHKLKFLDLCGCKYLSDKSVIQLAQNFPLLTYLNLTWCVSLTDRAVVEGISLFLTKLNLLSLYGLVEITNASIDSLVATPMKFTLETFDINGCNKVTQSDEATLRALFPNVQVLIYHS